MKIVAWRFKQISKWYNVYVRVYVCVWVYVYMYVCCLRDALDEIWIDYTN